MTGDYTLPNITRGKHLAPGPDRWQVLSPDEARLVMGGHVAIREPGTTVGRGLVRKVLIADVVQRRRRTSNRYKVLPRPLLSL